MVSLLGDQKPEQIREKKSLALGSEDRGLGGWRYSPRAKLLVCRDEDEVRTGATP